MTQKPPYTSLTAAESKALLYFAAQQLPVGFWPASVATRTVRKIAERGFIQKMEPAGGVGMVRWIITATGRDALNGRQ